MALEPGDAVTTGNKKKVNGAGGVRKQGRGRGLRTRSGCLTCRKRHVKCDEVRPDCTQCSRNQKTCIYPTELPDQTRPYTSTTEFETTTRVRSPDQISTRAEHGVAEEGHVLDPQPTMDNRDLEPMATTTFSLTSPASVETNSACQPIGIATARWFGMLAGDADLEIGPSPRQDDYSTEQRRTNNLAGSHEQPSQVGLPGETSSFQLQHTTSPEDELWTERLFWQSPTRLVLQDLEQRLFDTFVERISLWLDVLDPFQNFASLVPRLALWNIGLLNAILTLSVRYHSLRTDATDGLSFARKDALQYYHETLHYVRKAMQYESYHTSDELLATTIIISAYEMLDGSSRDWERHLQGVFWIQRSQVIHGDSGGLRAAIWWIWLCQDAWAAFRDRRKVFTFWKPQRGLSQLGPSELAARSVFILGRVINYCAPDHANDSIENISEKVRQAESLSALLDEWEDLLTPHFTPLPHHDAGKSVFPHIWIYPPMYSVSVQISSAARILILLHKPSLGGLHEGLKRQNSIDGHVEKIGGIACTLSDYASSTLSSQCLYIAGLSTFNQQYRDEILRLITVCRGRTGWPAVAMDEELKFHWGQHGGV